jgi:O-antigen/teichoic acid export membrane protein
VAKGGGVTFAGKMFLSASRLVTALILARLLGAEQYGFYNLSLSAANIAVVIAVFGLDTALLRYVAILDSRNDEEGVWGSLQLGIGTATILSVFTGTLLYAFAFPVAERVFNEPALAPLLQIVSVIVPMLVLSEVLVGANRGFKRMDTPVIAQFVAQPLIRLVLILILLLVGLDVTLAILTFGLADLGASLLLLYFLNREFALRRPLRSARRDARELFGFSIPVWLSEMMVKFQGNIQTLLLGSLGTITGVGLFSIANQITLVSSEFSSSINTSAKPIMAELHDRGDLKQMGRIYQIANKWAFTVQLPVLLGMVFFPTQILSIFGESFTDGSTALIILAFASLLRVGTGMGGIIIDMTGYAKLKLVNSVIRLVVYLGLNLLFIPRWGLLGAAAAILLGEGSINLLRLLQVLFLFKLIPYNWSFIKPITAGVLGVASLLAFSFVLQPDPGLFEAIAQGIVMLIVYVASLLIFGFTEQERVVLAHALQRIRAKVTRR